MRLSVAPPLRPLVVLFHRLWGNHSLVGVGQERIIDLNSQARIQNGLVLPGPPPLEPLAATGHPYSTRS
jgi:hypothetical protein